jgi:antitoxin VapB
MTEVVRIGQVYAWNPSITGIKSEDTILVAAIGNEVLTAIDSWPRLSVEVDGQLWERPAVLVL